MPKRKASSYNAASGRRYAGGSAGSRRAAAIGARLAARYPYAGYGRMYVPKGTATALAGESYRAANAEQRAWRRANNYTGVGGFWGDAWKKVKGFTKAHGRKVLTGLGGAMYGPAGAVSADELSTAIGLGSYRMGGVGAYGDISNNSIVHGGSGDSMAIANVNPSMSDDSGDVILSHSEFMGNVVASATLTAAGTVQSNFQNSAYPINPGLQGTFPFLCQLAQNFTMYKLEGCIFQYKPTSGEGGGSTNQLGKIVMATDYDPMALPFINSVQMENYQYSQSTKPSLAARHGVECAPSQGITDMKYVRTGTSNRDKSFTDYGLFQIATEGIPIAGTGAGIFQSNIGELWVSYKVRLSRANLYASLLGYSIRNDIFDYSIKTPSVVSNFQLPSASLTANNAKLTALQNIGTTITFTTSNGTTSPTTGASESICITWPASQILGVYKVTVISRLQSGDITTQMYVPYPSVPGKKTSDGLNQTQWCCPFIPTDNCYADPPCLPTVDSNGLPTWSDSSEATGGRLRCQTSVEQSSTPAAGFTGPTQLSQSTVITYVAINSPSTTIPKLCFEFKSVAIATGVAVANVNAAAFNYANNRYQIFIEQVNAEVSN